MLPHLGWIIVAQVIFLARLPRTRRNDAVGAGTAEMDFGAEFGMSKERTRTPSVWLWPLTLAAVLTAVLALIVWRPASSALEREISARERERVEDQLAIIGTAVQQSLRSRISILEGIAAFVESESTSGGDRSIRETRERFAAFAGNLPLEEAGILQAWIARSAIVTAVAPPTGTRDLLGRRRHPADSGATPGETRVEFSDIAAPNGEALVTAVVEVIGAGPPSVQVGLDFYARALIDEANLGRFGRDIILSLRDGGGRSVFTQGRGDLVDPAVFPIGVSRGFWMLAAVPAGGWSDAADTYVPIFRAAGWALSALLGLLVLYTRSARARRRTRTRRMEADLLESEARFNEIASSIPGVIFRLVRKPSGTIQYSYLSEGARDVFGVESAQATADSSWLRRTIHPDDRTKVDDMLGASGARQTPLTFEFRVVSNGGETKWLRSISLPRMCPNGDVIWTGHMADITGAKRRLELLEKSESSFRAAFDAHPDGIALYDHDGGLVASNDAAQGMFGSVIPPLTKPESGPEPGQKPDAAAPGLARIRRPNGASAWVLTDVRPIFRTGDAKPAGYLQTFTDVSDPHDHEAGLIKEGRVYKDAVDSALDVLWRTDADLRFTAMDETASGEPHPIAGALIGTRLLDLDNSNGEDGTEEIHRQIASREPFRNLRYDFSDPDADPDHGAGAGSGRVFRFSGTVAQDDAGVFLGYHGGVREETFAPGIPAMTPEQANLLAGLTRAADDLPVGIILFDRSDQFAFRNRAFDLVEPHTDLIRPGISSAGFHSALRERGVTPPVPSGEDMLTEQDAEVDVFFEGWIGSYWLQIRRHDLEGDGTLFVVSDLTDLKDEETHAARRQMVDAAFDAACRIAADLNHALADSLGDLTRLRQGRADDDPDAPDMAIERALASSERGALLGMQLLSLLQGRTSGPPPADLSALASDTSEMLRAALQDRADLEGLTAEALAATTIDAVMLEYIVLTLIASTQAHLPGTAKIQVHSHDARLGAEAANGLGVPAGDYVIIDVVYPAAAAATLLQFKLLALGPAAAAGAGEDLGLSLAARFLRQSGGHVAVVASGDGRATVKILLPRRGEAAEHEAGLPEAELSPTQGPGPAPETEPAPAREAQLEAAARRSAIVVEPDPDVRRMTASLLRQLNYEVMDSGDAEDAIAYSDEAPADLLVAGSRLRGPWTGEALAARLRRTAPHLRVVLTSDTGPGAADATSENTALLLKPFGLDELSALVN